MPPRRYDDPNEDIAAHEGTLRVEAIKDRCRLVEPGIVLVQHPPESNAAVFDVQMRAVLDIAEPFKRYVIVNDLAELSHRPKGEHFEAIVHAVNTMSLHWAIVQPRSAFLRIVARFLLARVTRAGVGWSVHDSIDSAVAAARDELVKAGGP
jgi:hypothetical protein